MADKIITTASGTVGKPGETTTAAPDAASARPDRQTPFTPEGIDALLSAALQEPADPNAGPAGEEVRPAGEGEGGAVLTEEQKQEQEQAELERLTAKAEAEGKTVEEIQAEEAEAAADEPSALPEHLEAELQQWEENGGQLPPSLQTLFNKRVGKAMKERDDSKAEADAARTEAESLRAELDEAKASGRAPANPTGGLNPETLDQSVSVAKRLVADVRALVGNYATEEQQARLEKYGKAMNLDQAGLQRSADEWSEWLRDEVPQLRQSVAAFKGAEIEGEKQAKEFFPTLFDKTSKDYALGQEVLQLVPELKQRSPAWRLAQGIYVLGMREFEKLKAAKAGKPVNGKPAAAVPKIAGALPGKAPVKSPVAGAPPARPRTSTGREQQEEAASRQLKENPTGENAIAALASALR